MLDKTVVIITDSQALHALADMILEVLPENKQANRTKRLLQYYGDFGNASDLYPALITVHHMSRPNARKIIQLLDEMLHNRLPDILTKLAPPGYVFGEVRKGVLGFSIPSTEAWFGDDPFWR